VQSCVVNYLKKIGGRVGQDDNKQVLQGRSIVQWMQLRNSQPQLCEPAPSTEELEQLFKVVLRAPDHMRLRPWRYIIVSGEARVRLGEVFCQAAMQARQNQTQQAKAGQPLSEAQQQKFKNMPLRAPMIAVGIARIHEHEKVPGSEQIISAGVGMGYLLLALQALGYGGMWRTGEMAGHPLVKKHFKLADNEQIIGFLYMGTPAAPAKAISYPEFEDHVEIWA